jgi:DNA-binding ferritin-like protein
MISAVLKPVLASAASTFNKIKPFLITIGATVLVMLYVFSRDKRPPEDVAREQRLLQTVDRLLKQNEDLLKNSIASKDSMVKLKDEYYQHLMQDWSQEISNIQKERDEKIDSVDHGDDDFIRRYMSAVDQRQYGGVKKEP